MNVVHIQNMNLIERVNFYLSTFKTLEIFIILISVVKCDSSIEYKVVETENGKVKGLQKISLIKNIEFYAFKGIPYAENPIGELRFKAPEPAEPWIPNVLDATEHGSTCIRPNQIDSDTLPKDENCLFLNVYVPADVKSDEKLAVLVYIHGGAFSEGSGNDISFGPDFIIEQNAILVTMNYRLGVFGFLSLNTPEYSGNMALKDQQLALKWVHSNIEHFSGDPERVLLFGESAGGAMTHLHVLSSESRKYFRNAALLSGSAENFWCFSEDNASRLAYKMANDLGETVQNMEELVSFLQNVPAEKIVNYGSVFPWLKRCSRGPLAPVIEKPDAIRPFIVKYPTEIYEELTIDVDVMFSLCSNEYMIFYMATLEEVYNFEGLDSNFTIRLPFKEASMDFSTPEYRELAQQIREFYFKNKQISKKKTLKEYIKLLSDINYAYHIDKAAKQHAEKTNAKTFYYRFSIDSKLNQNKLLNSDLQGLSGAAHADDLCYIFRCERLNSIYEEILQDKENEQSKITLRAIENVTKILTNFAKYGEPTHEEDRVAEFLPVSKDEVHFVDITNDGLKPGVNPNYEANVFWNQIEQQIHDINTKSRILPREEL